MNKNTLKLIVIAGLFTIPFVPFLVSSAFFFPFITTKAFFFRFVIEIVFASWVLLALLAPEYRPKKSRLLYAMLAFGAAVLVADLLGIAPAQSIWSNFERMEGFVLIAHMIAFFVVISSVFREADWRRWWNTSLVAAFLMVCYCTLQLLGLKTINQGGVRVDGTFGNAIYLAVYMLFHIFIAFFYYTREKKGSGLRWAYLFSIVTNAAILYFTATRGTILGLIGGFIIFALLNIRNKENAWARKMALAVIAAVVILTGGFFAFRNASFVQKSPVLSRFASLSFSEAKTQGRYYVWPMALQGIKERPLLGWGQDNFIYVFQEHYNPAMYNLEPWFDRAHNVFLDWGIAGGIVTLALYLSLYVFALLAIWRGTLSHLEKTILTGLIAGYFFHNLFVFDQLVSYILFFSLLGYLESRKEAVPLWQKPSSPERVQGAYAPLAALLLIGTIYFIVWKPLTANAALIDGLIAVQSNQPAAAISAFERSYSKGPLGQPEEAEQMVSHAPEILTSSLPLQQRNDYYAFLTNVVRSQAAKFPNNVRTQLLAGMFFTETGTAADAEQYLQKALTLSPTKQEVYFQIASAYIAGGDAAGALPFFKKAYELAPAYDRAKTLYLAGAIYAGDRALEAELRASMDPRALAFDDTILSAYYENKRYAEVIALLEQRKAFDPANAAKYDAYIKQIPGK